MALYVHYKTLYVSQPFSAKQQREITTFCVFRTTPASPDGKFFMCQLENDACSHIFSLRKNVVRQAEYIQPFAKFVREIQVHFLIDVLLKLPNDFPKPVGKMTRVSLFETTMLLIASFCSTRRKTLFKLRPLKA